MTSGKLWPVSTCMSGNGNGAGRNAFSASRRSTIESLPPLNSSTGLASSAATSRMTWIASASRTSTCVNSCVPMPPPGPFGIGADAPSTRPRRPPRGSRRSSRPAGRARPSSGRRARSRAGRSPGRAAGTRPERGRRAPRRSSTPGSEPSRMVPIRAKSTLPPTQCARPAAHSRIAAWKTSVPTTRRGVRRKRRISARPISAPLADRASARAAGRARRRWRRPTAFARASSATCSRSRAPRATGTAPARGRTRRDDHQRDRDEGQQRPSRRGSRRVEQHDAERPRPARCRTPATSTRRGRRCPRAGGASRRAVFVTAP